MINGSVPPDRRATEHFAAPARGLTEPIELYGLWTNEMLRDAVLEGSGRAAAELQRRGLGLPVSAGDYPAWL